jgi:crossover junction endodeoxyribonuclease RusA
MWRVFRGRAILSADGRAYRKAVADQVLIQRAAKHITQPVKVSITAYRPDNRKRDLDNLLKACLDGLSHAGVFVDDSQIVDLRIRWGDSIGGFLRIEVESVDDQRTGYGAKKSKAHDHHR